MPLVRIPSSFSSTSCNCDLEDLPCSEVKVFYLLSSIDPSKSSGSDAVADKMLKINMASAIAPAVNVV